jgi:serine/threonine protein kinase
LSRSGLSLKNALFTQTNCWCLARLLVYSLIRQNPLERPSAKEILISDWFQSELSESAFTPSSSQSRPHVTVQLVMPANGRLADVNPRIPQQLLGVLMQPAADRNNIYLNRSNIRVNMESFANALNRNMVCSSAFVG